MLVFVLILLALSGALMVILTFIAFQRRSSPLAMAFAASTLCAAIWDFGFAAELLAPTLAEKLFWANVQFFGICFLPVAWLAVTMIATAQPRWLHRLLPFLGIIPVLTLLAIWTDPLHNTFRGSPEIVTQGVPFPVLAAHYGPFFYGVHAPYEYALFAISLFLLVYSWKGTPAVYRRQRITLIFSLVFPLLVDFLYVVGLSPVKAFNFTSIVFSFSGLLMAINVLSLRFLDVLPLAYEAVVNEMNVGVIVLDALERVSYLNPAAEQITGVENDRAIGIETRQLFGWLDPVWRAETGSAEVALEREGTEKTYQVQRSTIARSRNRVLGQVITLNDITERAELLRQVEKLSITDALTGALNRRALMTIGANEVTRANRYGRKLALIMLDIDDFKEVNDRCGHPFGDETLKVVVAAIKERTRANDLIFRYGGDEFILLLHEADKARALLTAERIRDELGRLNRECEQLETPDVMVSIGMTSLKPGDALDDLLCRADEAMYRAKAAGKNQIAVG